MKIIALVTLILVGCSYPKKSDPFEPGKIPKNHSTIFVYREDTVLGSFDFDVPRIYINDQLVGKLLIGGYFPIKVSPGPNEISVRDSLFQIPMPWKSKRFNVTATDNSPVFIRYSHPSEFTTGPRFTVVPAEKGIVEASKTSLLEN